MCGQTPTFEGGPVDPAEVHVQVRNTSDRVSAGLEFEARFHGDSQTVVAELGMSPWMIDRIGQVEPVH